MIPEHSSHESQQLNAVVWIGKEDGRWPMVAFESQGAAQRWQAADVREVRRIWELRTETAVERIVEVPDLELRWRA